MAKNHIRDYDLTAGNNTDVDGVNIAEGTAPSNINDAIREVMAHQAELHGDTRGGLVSGGAAGAYTLTSNESLAAYAQSGGLFVFEANHAMPSTVTATLNIDAVGTKPLRKHVSLPLVQNDIKANQIVVCAYEGATDVFHVLSVLGNDPAFASGTKMLFQQTNAPSGWTKEVTHDNKALRVVTGTPSSGGADTFTTVFGTSKATDGTVLLESHLPTSAIVSGPNLTDFVGSSPVPIKANAGGGNAHTHPISNLDIAYVDVIIATKD